MSLQAFASHPPPRGQNAKTKVGRGFAKSSSYRSCTLFAFWIQNAQSLAKVSHTFSPQKIVLAKPSPHWSPATLPEYLFGRNTKKKNVLSILEKSTSAKIEKARNIFSFWCCQVKRGGGGAIRRAYDLISSHHALRARRNKQKPYKCRYWGQKNINISNFHGWQKIMVTIFSKHPKTLLF